MEALTEFRPIPSRARAGTMAYRARAVVRVIEAMKARLAEEISHQGLARIALLSPYHFNRVFRQVTGIAPLQYLYAMRLAAAKRLLLTTRRSITDVCFDVGYNSLGTFTSRFTREVGRSPRQFRRLRERLGCPELFEGAAASSEAVPAGSVVHGRVMSPGPSPGLIFVGLFPRPIPAGRPVGCAFLSGAGEYRIGPVPDGLYYSCAVALDHSLGPLHFALGEDAPRGRAGPILVQGGRVSGLAEIVLRPAEPTDPPILVSLPLIAPGLVEKSTTCPEDGIR